jgi:hypothetical protein
MTDVVRSIVERRDVRKSHATDEKPAQDRKGGKGKNPRGNSD